MGAHARSWVALCAAAVLLAGGSSDAKKIAGTALGVSETVFAVEIGDDDGVEIVMSGPSEGAWWSFAWGGDLQASGGGRMTGAYAVVSKDDTEGGVVEHVLGNGTAGQRVPSEFVVIEVDVANTTRTVRLRGKRQTGRYTLPVDATKIAVLSACGQCGEANPPPFPAYHGMTRLAVVLTLEKQPDEEAKDDDDFPVAVVVSALLGAVVIIALLVWMYMNRNKDRDKEGSMNWVQLQQVEREIRVCSSPPLPPHSLPRVNTLSFPRVTGSSRRDRWAEAAARSAAAAAAAATAAGRWCIALR